MLIRRTTASIKGVFQLSPGPANACELTQALHYGDLRRLYGEERTKDHAQSKNCQEERQKRNYHARRTHFRPP
jgi:hypothetical protein